MKREGEKSFNRLGSWSDLNYRGTLSSARLSLQQELRSPSSSDSPLGLGTNTGSDGQQFSSPHHMISFVSASNFPIWRVKKDSCRKTDSLANIINRNHDKRLTEHHCLCWHYKKRESNTIPH